jgi:hypothetical protein
MMGVSSSASRRLGKLTICRIATGAQSLNKRAMAWCDAGIDAAHRDGRPLRRAKRRHGLSFPPGFMIDSFEK